MTNVLIKYARCLRLHLIRVLNVGVTRQLVAIFVDRCLLQLIGELLLRCHLSGLDVDAQLVKFLLRLIKLIVGTIVKCLLRQLECDLLLLGKVV